MNLRNVIVLITFTFLLITPTSTALNTTLLESQGELMNDAMSGFVFLALIVTLMSFIGLTNFSNSLTVGVGSIMASFAILFILKVMGIIS